MASTSETTFGNRLEHGRTLNEALGKIAGYKPENNILAVNSFSLFLDSVELGNNNVAGDGQTLSDARKARRLAYFGDAKQGVAGLPTLAGRVRDCVGAMPGGKKSPSYPRIQKLTQKISNYRPPKKPVSPSPGETTTEKKKVSQSEASYGSLVQQGRDLAAAVAKVAGYNPNSADLTPGALTASMKTLSDQNKAVADALIDASTSIDKRSKLYDDSQNGLRALFQQAKAAVGSQFGRRSPEYANVSKIRY
jgi:hypothetical protein